MPGKTYAKRWMAPLFVISKDGNVFQQVRRGNNRKLFTGLKERQGVGMDLKCVLEMKEVDL